MFFTSACLKFRTCSNWNHLCEGPRWRVCLLLRDDVCIREFVRAESQVVAITFPFSPLPFLSAVVDGCSVENQIGSSGFSFGSDQRAEEIYVTLQKRNWGGIWLI